MSDCHEPLKLLDLQRQHAALQGPLREAIERVVSQGAFIRGPDVAAFEDEFSQFLGAPHVIGCGSGTDALQLAFMALDVGPGDEVITTPFTFVATVEAIVLLGATPVFVDIDPDTFNMRVDQIESRITSKTKAIVPVHLYGQAVDMTPLMKVADGHGIAVIEDVAQATGATIDGRITGTIGNLGCFSFFPAKNLGCFGDGGAVCVQDEEIAQRVRMIGNHGAHKRYFHELVGINSRLDTLQAAVLRVKLQHLPGFNQGRAKVAAWYNQALAPLVAAGHLQTPIVRPDRDHVYQQYTIRCATRDVLSKALQEVGVPSAVHYPVPLHRQPAFAKFAPETGLPEAERAAAEVLSLPMFPEMRADEAKRVVDAITAHFA